VEQQILVSELVALVRLSQDNEARKRKERTRKSVYRERISKTVPGQSQDKRKEPKEKYIYKPQGGSRGDLSPDILANQFSEFWDAYPRKVAKGDARKAYRNALKRATHAEILAGVKRYAASKPDPKFTKHPASWLNADCWLDEDSKKSPTVTQGPWKPFKPSQQDPTPPSSEERERQVQQVLKKATTALKA